MTTIAVSGCGGHAATRQDVIARGNAICFAALQSIRSVPPPAGGPSSSPALSAYFSKVAPIADREVRQLRSLPRPVAGRATLAAFVDAVAKEGSVYRSLAAAARRGNARAVSAALSGLRESPAATLARRYGMTECTGAAGTGS